MMVFVPLVALQIDSVERELVIQYYFEPFVRTKKKAGMNGEIDTYTLESEIVLLILKFQTILSNVIIIILRRDRNVTFKFTQFL